MARFALSTIRNGSSSPEAAITMEGNHYVLSKVDGQTFSKQLSVKHILEDWPATKSLLQALADKISEDSAGFSHARNDKVVLETPLRFPNKLLAVGANYASHLKEMGLPTEKWEPMPFFSCPPTTSLVGPGETVKYPTGTSQFDWECELVVVVGSKLRNASTEEASTAIAGYTVGLDLSCRDLLAPGQGGLIDLMRGKAQESMKPCGPSFVPKEFVKFDQGLSVKLAVNGQQMIDGTTADMVWKPEECLVEISKVITIEPGDIVFTGTPAGSAKSHGNRWLRVGDRISAEIESVGTLDVEVVV